MEEGRFAGAALVCFQTACFTWAGMCRALLVGRGAAARGLVVAANLAFSSSRTGDWRARSSIRPMLAEQHLP